MRCSPNRNLMQFVLCLAANQKMNEWTSNVKLVSPIQVFSAQCSHIPVTRFHFFWKRRCRGLLDHHESLKFEREFPRSLWYRFLLFIHWVHWVHWVVMNNRAHRTRAKILLPRSVHFYKPRSGLYLRKLTSAIHIAELSATIIYVFFKTWGVITTRHS